MSPPEPIDELNDQQASVIKSPKIAVAILRLVAEIQLVSINKSD
jgi:hypothetical protein